MYEIRFTQADMKLLLESLIELQHKLYDRSYLCRDGERREKVIVQIAETEELIKKVQKVVKKSRACEDCLNKYARFKV